MNDPAKGVIAMIFACITWGLSPIFYAQLAHVPSLEILCYRALWSLAFFALVLFIQRRLRLALAACRSNFMTIACAALMISANWFLFIYAVNSGQGVEASLGYYILPLFAVVIGRFTFNENLGRLQWFAVVLAAIAVLILTLGLGVAPWIALSLASTFSVYGVIKKRLDLGPVVSVTAEVLMVAPLALAYLFAAGTQADAAWDTHLLLMLAGPLTATPLILFSYAARRAKLSTIGLVQYLNPTLQFSCAVLFAGEVVTRWHGIAFPLIWLALAIYSIAVLRQDRASRKDVSKAATSGTIVT